MLSPQKIEFIAKNEYGIICMKSCQIRGYLDKNYWLKEEGSGKEYVLRATGRENFFKSKCIDTNLYTFFETDTDIFKIFFTDTWLVADIWLARPKPVFKNLLTDIFFDILAEYFV